MSGSKEQILACARDIFLEEGLSHFSMRKVAACVGFSATALYRHYVNRDELLFQVILKGFRIFSGYLQQVDERQEPLTCLEATTTAYLNFALNEPAYYQMMFMSSEEMTGLKRLSEEGAAEMQQTFEILQRRVQRAVDADVIETDDSRATAFAIWAYAHGQISLYLCGRANMEKRDLVSLYHKSMGAHLHNLQAA